MASSRFRRSRLVRKDAGNEAMLRGRQDAPPALQARQREAIRGRKTGFQYLPDSSAPAFGATLFNPSVSSIW